MSSIDSRWKQQSRRYFLKNGEKAFKADKLIYHSSPLDQAVEIAGYVKMKLFIELNVPDTDLWVGFYEIRPDGKSIWLAEDFMRARYRKSPAKPELVTPGKIYPYVFDKSYFFARRVKKGSRFRLIISCLNSPDSEKNYNSGGIVSQESAKDARKAVIKLYHDNRYPSHIEVPITGQKKKIDKH